MRDKEAGFTMKQPSKREERTATAGSEVKERREEKNTAIIIPWAVCDVTKFLRSVSVVCVYSDKA